MALLAPRISGSPQLRGRLECGRGTWDDAAAARYPVTYQWYRDGVAVATTPALELRRDDVTHEFTCAVTAAGLTEARSEALRVPAPTALSAPSETGRAWVGRELVCDRGTWNDREGLRYVVSYRWERELANGWIRQVGHPLITVS